MSNSLIIEGDCLQVMQSIPDKSIGMILCDPPYGTTYNNWDKTLSFELLWKQYERIIKDDGIIVLFAQGKFTAHVILSNEKLFKYKITWIKSLQTNFLNAKKQPLRTHEDICIFYGKSNKYFPQMTEGLPYDKGIRSDKLTGSYRDFKPVHVMSNGGRYPLDVIFFKNALCEGKTSHSTQKPVALGRYLIKTYSNPDDVILDNACGSGSFLVSAALENRKSIGIELNSDILLFKTDKIDLIDVTLNRLQEASIFSEKTVIRSTELNNLAETITNFINKEKTNGN